MKPTPAPVVYVVPWFYPPADGRQVGKPETCATTLNTVTIGLLISSPFGRDTDCMLEIYADKATGEIVTTVGAVRFGDDQTERRWEPYMDSRQWGTSHRRRKTDEYRDENDHNEPDED